MRKIDVIALIPLLLFAAAAVLLFRTTIHFRIWHTHRAMPLLLGLLLVSLFIWLSENIGTYTKTWLYPTQHHGWAMVSFGKLGSWFLLLMISYTLVSLINAPQVMAVESGTTDRERAEMDEAPRRPASA